MRNDCDSLLVGQKLFSKEIGILTRLVRLPLLNQDPKIWGYGIWPCNTSRFSFEQFTGRSSGCGTSREEALLGTIGETVERYCSAFYDIDEGIKSSYEKMSYKSIHPNEFALFHEKQYKNESFYLKPFDTKSELTWFKTIDLANGGDEVYCPGAVLYLPWTRDEHPIDFTTSTGLAAHTNLHKAILTGIYELIERDSFTITWLQNIVPPKLIIDSDTRNFIEGIFPRHYKFHLFDITYDFGVPSVFGICVGESDFGKFIAVGASSRGTMQEAVRKALKEIAQGVGYIRFLLGQNNQWNPDDNFFGNCRF